MLEAVSRSLPGFGRLRPAWGLVLPPPRCVQHRVVTATRRRPVSLELGPARGILKPLPGILWLAGALLAAAPAAHAQPTPGCSDEKSNQFDFWIGEWEVTADGKVAGTNRIQPILDGCVLMENWTGASGSRGASFNFYNPSTGKWQQFWVWKLGTTLELEGEYRDGKMILAGTSRTRDGKTVDNRITWYNNKDGTVRQHWETSADGGKTWATAFDGLYKKKKG
jgi:hypothetical protein